MRINRRHGSVSTVRVKQLARLTESRTTPKKLFSFAAKTLPCALIASNE